MKSSAAATQQLTQAVTGLTQLQTQINAALSTALPNIAQVFSNPPATQVAGLDDQFTRLRGTITDLSHAQTRPALPAYTPQRPQKWVNDTLAIIELWSADHFELLTQESRTIADATADPPSIAPTERRGGRDSSRMLTARPATSQDL